MAVTETRVGGDKAARIIEDLLFDRSIVTDTIDYAGVYGFCGRKMMLMWCFYPLLSTKCMQLLRCVPLTLSSLFLLYMLALGCLRDGFFGIILK